MTSLLNAYVESRREGTMDESERGVLDAAIQLAADKKARLLERRFKEPEIEDVEVMVLPSARSKGGKVAPKAKPTTVSKLSGAINERGIPYVVLNDIPDLPPRAPQPARYDHPWGCRFRKRDPTFFLFLTRKNHVQKKTGEERNSYDLYIPLLYLV